MTIGTVLAEQLAAADALVVVVRAGDYAVE